jgi:chromatin remodeling complex protein RSC6
VAPKEKTELERAKEEAEARAKKEAEEAANGSPMGKSGKKKKKVGFATTS